jgi:hypothetical protein
MLENTDYSDSINIEISKGRTFEQILNEEPSENCTSSELYAWLDAGDIANKNKIIPNNFKLTYRKVKLLELSLIILISVMLISPFIVPNYMFLLLNIPLGILVGIIGRTNSRLYNSIETKVELNELTKHLTIKGYTKRVLVKEFIIKLIFTPFQLVCLACEIIFPPFKK